FLEPHREAAAFEQHADGRRGEPLAEGTDHAARNEDVFGHGGYSMGQARGVSARFGYDRRNASQGRKEETNHRGTETQSRKEERKEQEDKKEEKRKRRMPF